MHKLIRINLTTLGGAVSTKKISRKFCEGRLFPCFREKFYKQWRMLRLEFAGQKVYHGGNPANILKRVFSGAVFYFAVGQHWHTNRFFGFCVSAGRCLVVRVVPFYGYFF